MHLPGIWRASWWIGLGKTRCVPSNLQCTSAALDSQFGMEIRVGRMEEGRGKDEAETTEAIALTIYPILLLDEWAIMSIEFMYGISLHPSPCYGLRLKGWLWHMAKLANSRLCRAAENWPRRSQKDTINHRLERVSRIFQSLELLDLAIAHTLSCDSPYPYRVRLRNMLTPMGWLPKAPLRRAVFMMFWLSDSPWEAFLGLHFLCQYIIREQRHSLPKKSSSKAGQRVCQMRCPSSRAVTGSLCLPKRSCPSQKPLEASHLIILKLKYKPLKSI